MRVQEVLIEDNNKRYILLDQEGFPVMPVMKYIKYLDKTGKKPNTQRTYCYSLKHFYTYLEDLVGFLGCLRSTYQSSNVTPLHQKKAKRTETTINHTITVIANFYDYLYLNEEVQNDMMEKLMKQVFTGRHSRYKSFLHHVNKDKPLIRNILKLKEPRKRVETLTKEQVLQATTNIQDKFLIQLLFETGLRIGEALSLFMEDFVYDHQKGHRIRLVERGELEKEKYELHIKTTIKAIEIAKQRGREDIAEKNEKNLQRYQNIFNTLQEGNIIFGRQERMKRKLGVKNG